MTLSSSVYPGVVRWDLVMDQVLSVYIWWWIRCCPKIFGDGPGVVRRYLVMDQVLFVYIWWWTRCCQYLEIWWWTRCFTGIWWWTGHRGGIYDGILRWFLTSLDRYLQLYTYCILQKKKEFIPVKTVSTLLLMSNYTH